MPIIGFEMRNGFVLQTERGSLPELGNRILQSLNDGLFYMVYDIYSVVFGYCNLTSKIFRISLSIRL